MEGIRISRKAIIPDCADIMSAMVRPVDPIDTLSRLITRRKRKKRRRAYRRPGSALWRGGGCLHTQGGGENWAHRAVRVPISERDGTE